MLLRRRFLRIKVVDGSPVVSTGFSVVHLVQLHATSNIWYELMLNLCCITSLR